MRRAAVAIAVASLLVVAVVAPAGAAGKRSTYASISSVQPEYLLTATDDYGTYCLYQATVTMSWNGSIRLWVAQFVDGQRQAPGELALKGSGTNVRVTVQGIGVRAGHSGPFVAEAQVLKRFSWVVIDSEQSHVSVNCPNPG